MLKLSGSVGRGGLNKKADVRLVQGLLNNYKIPGVSCPIEIDGKVGDETYTRIDVFQNKALHTLKPDGRVDPGGQSFTRLTNRPCSKLALSYSVSIKGINLLKAIEVLHTKPYDDQTGKTITKYVSGATIGYGHLIKKNEWKKYSKGLTKAQSLALFKEDLAPFSRRVKNKVKTKIMQYEFDAMVILAFNIGKGGFSKSSVLKLVNNPGAKTSYSDLEHAWLAWNKSQKKYNKGVVNRRKAEWKIYTKNIYLRW